MFGLIPHIHLKILHPFLLFLYLLIQLPFLPQNCSNIEFHIDFIVLRHWSWVHLLFHLFGVRLLHLLFNFRKIGWSFGSLKLKLIFLFILIIKFLDVVLNLLPSLFFLILNNSKILIGFRSWICLETNLYLLYLRHHLRFGLCQIKFLKSSRFLLHIFNILLTICVSSLVSPSSCIFTDLHQQLVTFFLSFTQFRKQFLFKVLHF